MNKEEISAKAQLLSEKEKAIMYLGMGGNEFDELYYEVDYESGERICFTSSWDTNKKVYVDWCDVMTHMFNRKDK